MIKVLITEEGKSNKPVAVLSICTQVAVFDYWTEQLVSNPGKYRIQIDCNFVFSEDCSKAWHNVFGALCLAYVQQKGILTDDNSKCAFIGVLQGFAFAEERLNNES